MASEENHNAQIRFTCIKMIPSQTRHFNRADAKMHSTLMDSYTRSEYVTAKPQCTNFPVFVCI